MVKFCPRVLLEGWYHLSIVDMDEGIIRIRVLLEG